VQKGCIFAGQRGFLANPLFTLIYFCAKNALYIGVIFRKIFEKTLIFFQKNDIFLLIFDYFLNVLCFEILKIFITK